MYVDGCSERRWSGWWFFGRYKLEDCHAWVVDGVRNRRRRVTRTTYTYDSRRGAAGHYSTSYSYYQTEKQFHCNWGWSRQNGDWITGRAFNPEDTNYKFGNYGLDMITITGFNGNGVSDRRGR